MRPENFARAKKLADAISKNETRLKELDQGVSVRVGQEGYSSHVDLDPEFLSVLRRVVRAQLESQIVHAKKEMESL